MGCASSSPAGFAEIDALSNQNERGWSLSIRHVDHEFKNRVHAKTSETRVLIEKKLGSHSLFSVLVQDGLRDVVDAMEPVRVEPGEAMITQGETLTNLYIIESGFLVGSKSANNTDSSAETRTFAKGAIIGEKAMMSEQSSQATYSNSSNTVVLAWRINSATYRNILAVNGERIAHRNRVRLALAGCPFLDGVEGDVLDGVADETAQVTPLDSGAPVPGLIPRQPATHLWLVVKGKVLETLALRPDGGTRTRDSHEEFVVAKHRRYEVGVGQLAGTHSLLCGLSHHVGSASAARGGATEVIPVPLEALTATPAESGLGGFERGGGGLTLSRSAKKLLMADLCERVLTSQPEFAAFPQTVIKTLVAAMPSRKYAAGDIVMREGFRSSFMFFVCSGELSLTQSPVAGRLQRRKEQASAKRSERESMLQRSSSASFDSSSASSASFDSSSASFDSSGGGASTGRGLGQAKPASPLSPLLHSSTSGAELNELRTRDAAEVIWQRMRERMKESGMRKIHDLFNEMDADGSGFVDRSEFKAALERMGIGGVSDKVVRRVMRTADPNGDGKLDFRELIDVLKPSAVDRGRGAELDEMQTKEAAAVVWSGMRAYMDRNGISSIQAIFREMDTDQSGAIDAEEFQAFLEKLGITDVSSKVVRRVIRSADPDGSGDIDVQELARVLKRHRQASGLEHSPRNARRSKTDGFGQGQGGDGGEEEDDVDVEEVADAVWKRMRAFAKQNGMTRVSELLREFDADGSGAIDEAELGGALEKMGISGVGPSVLRAVIRVVDIDGDGEIDLRELVAALKAAAGSSGGGSGRAKKKDLRRQKSWGVGEEEDDCGDEKGEREGWSTAAASFDDTGSDTSSHTNGSFDFGASPFQTPRKLGGAGSSMSYSASPAMLEIPGSPSSSSSSPRAQLRRQNSTSSSSSPRAQLRRQNSSSSASSFSASKPRRQPSLNRGSSYRSSIYRKEMSEEEYLHTLSQELPTLFSQPGSVPPRVADVLPDDGAQVEVKRLRGADTLGVALMKPLDDAAAEAVAKGNLLATSSATAAVAGASAASKRARGGLARQTSFTSLSASPSSANLFGGDEDGSVQMTESLVAATDCEVLILSRAVFMRALNVSRWILKRRLKDKEQRLNDAAAADDEAEELQQRQGRRGGQQQQRGARQGGGGRRGSNARALAAVKAGLAEAERYDTQNDEGHFDDDDDEASGVAARNGGSSRNELVDLGVGAQAALSHEHWAWFSRREIRLSNLREVRVLGQGGFGLVRCVCDKQTGQQFALKALAKTRLKEQKMSSEEIFRERDAQVLCGSHPFVCQLFNAYEDSKALYILLELQTGRELYHLIYKPVKAPLGRAYTQFLVASLILALEHVHSKNFAFRDLKPENVMITEEFYPKLIDFGFAKELPLGERTFTLCGTPEYLAPEVILGTGHDRSVDMWTLGILAYECRAAATPFEAPPLTEDEKAYMSPDQIKRKRKNTIMENAVSKKAVFSPERFSASEDRACVEWIIGALAKDPDRRNTDAKAKFGEYLRHMRWDDLLTQTKNAPPLR